MTDRPATPGRRPGPLSRTFLHTLVAMALVAAMGTVLTAATWSRAGRIFYPERFAAGMTYREFVATDSAKRELWTTVYAKAPATVASLEGRIAALRAKPGRWHLLVVAESWCPDAANAVPYLQRLAEAAGNVELRLLRKAEAKDLLKAHPLDGRDATPLVVLLDERFVERGTWIEQPVPLRKLVAQKTGRVCESTLKANVRAWREQDAGRSVLGEVLALMEGAEQAKLALPAPPKCPMNFPSTSKYLMSWRSVSTVAMRPFVSTANPRGSEKFAPPIACCPQPLTKSPRCVKSCTARPV